MSPSHIEVACPNCQRVLRARREYVGRTVACKHCGTPFPLLVPDDRQVHPPPEDGTDDDRVSRREWDQLQVDLSTVRLRLAETQDRAAALDAELTAVRAERDRLAGEG